MATQRAQRAVRTALLAAACGLVPVAPAALAAQTVDLDELRRTNDGQRVVMYMGQRALESAGGTAWLDADLRDVVIEVDVALPSPSGFAGVRFRAVDDRNHEYYYLRAHQSGREDASQYMPVFNGLGSWQIHTGPRYAAPLELTGGPWRHLKLVAVGRRLEIYLDSNEPVQVVHRLIREPSAGAIGLAAGGGNPVRFANLRVRPATAADLHGTGAADEQAEEVDYIGSERREPAEGHALVERFRVSAPFPEAEVTGVEPLDLEAWADHGWQPLGVEEEGIANLARLSGNRQDGNTVFAAVTLTSDRARTVPVRVGFSDRARVFLNGRPIFAGADEWRARDFRFLGIIGLHDTVFLPLEAGPNELWIAVSEDFGGWGVMVEMPALDGLEVDA